MEKGTIFGILVGLGAIFVGNAIEGGHFGSLVQGTAALIVMGGTIGATLVSHRWQDIQIAMKYFKKAFSSISEERFNEVAKDIVNASKIARQDSILALDGKIKSFKSDYMKNVFRFVADGVDSQKLQEVFSSDIDIEEERILSGAKVWQDAGGYAPTIGILGAVLGLIHVMANLTNTNELGKGIAVAFVATIYGVGLANLLFLPIASKIKRRIQLESLEKQMILDGAISILNDFSPYLIEEKMRSYTRQLL